jgi:hypothetical protein
MSGKLLIILVILLVAFYVSGLVIGACRPTSEKSNSRERDNALPRLADSLFGWAAPGFDLDDLRIDGKPATKTIRIDPGRAYVFTIAAAKSESRRLTMSFEPGVPAIWARSLDNTKNPAIYITYEAKQPLPSEMLDEFPSPSKSIIPNLDQDDPKRRSSYDWPIMTNGAVLTIRSSLDHSVTLTIK